VADAAWRLVVASPAARHLDRLPEKAATAIVEALHTIAANPHRTGKPLKLGLAGLWSARRGDYRVLYEVDGERHLVTVVHIAHRADVYRRR
jgi:mRNA interferase RelE/StbE